LVTPHFLKSGVVVAEVFEAAFGDDAALVEDVHIVETGEQVEAVNRGYDGFVRESPEEAFVDERFGTGIDAAGRFVKKDQVAVTGSENATGQRKSLFLTAGKVDAFFPDIRFQTQGQLVNDFG
jgi:hypothetical protein